MATIGRYREDGSIDASLGISTLRTRLRKNLHSNSEGLRYTFPWYALSYMLRQLSLPYTVR